jgi:hypothetical protein
MAPLIMHFLACARAVSDTFRAVDTSIPHRTWFQAKVACILPEDSQTNHFLYISVRGIDGK